MIHASQFLYKYKKKTIFDLIFELFCIELISVLNNQSICVSMELQRCVREGFDYSLPRKQNLCPIAETLGPDRDWERPLQADHRSPGRHKAQQGRVEQSFCQVRGATKVSFELLSANLALSQDKLCNFYLHCRCLCYSCDKIYTSKRFIPFSLLQCCASRCFHRCLSEV